MLPRFLVSELAPAGTAVTLPVDEGRHLARVCRLTPGDPVRVFDGQGREVLARVEEVGRQLVTVRLIEPAIPAAESPVRIEVAQAALTGDKMDAIVRDLTMLGVGAVQPICSARSEIKCSTLVRSRRAERWRRVAVASAKQCGRAVLPQVGDPLELQDWLKTHTSGVRLVLVEPAGDVPAGGAGIPAPGKDRPDTSIALLVGPEGGWTAEEATLALGAGFVPWTLGTRTLRADAASLVAVSILQYLWGDLG
jgi:16S rRNA (uracil1498-N3)-methyltransferase